MKLPNDLRSRTLDGAIYPSPLSCRIARAATARSPSLVGAFCSQLKHCRQTLLHQLVQSTVALAVSHVWVPIRATNALLFARVIGHAAWSHDRSRFAGVPCTTLFSSPSIRLLHVAMCFLSRCKATHASPVCFRDTLLRESFHC